VESAHPRQQAGRGRRHRQPVGARCQSLVLDVATVLQPETETPRRDIDAAVTDQRCQEAPVAMPGFPLFHVRPDERRGKWRHDRVPDPADQLDTRYPIRECAGNQWGRDGSRKSSK